MRHDPEQVAQNIGRRIAELRQERGLTQEELAVKLKTTFQWVSQVESKTQNLTVFTLVKLANVLAVDPVELFLPVKPENRRVKLGRPKKSGAAKTG